MELLSIPWKELSPSILLGEVVKIPDFDMSCNVE